ncbi:MAG: hypothetical protein ACT4PE_09035 [Candidatus Eiseniibacteriota bacterium]
MTDFRALLTRLVDAGVEFIVVGGLAGIAHGAARSTQDVHVVYSRTEANLERLVRALLPVRPYLRGAPPGLPFSWDARTLRAGLNFTLETETGDIDLLGELTGGGTYENLLSSSIEILVFGHSVRCLSLRKLIEVKRAAGRPKDLEAIAELEALAEESGA